ncbi:hypothetical protein AVEN_126833-1 [Araneus ventricosus]|uniref:Uncharacterized protein n=1 Tax=Araneus ventricosus TaxID=182803 RepID=A0A4Y2HSY5_ARAVE|nr:hypothetical protein AVEN_126833-1 [Araneus ventricosus]
MISYTLFTSLQHNLPIDQPKYKVCPNEKEATVISCKGVGGFSVETAGSGKHPFSPSSDSLTDAWAPTVHKLCHNQASVDYVMHSSFAYRQFNSNFTCGDPTILPYELIHSRNRGSVGHNVRLPRARQVLEVYASRLITLTPPEYGAPRETLLSVHLFHPTINLCSMLPFCAKILDNCSSC